MLPPPNFYSQDSIDRQMDQLELPGFADGRMGGRCNPPVTVRFIRRTPLLNLKPRIKLFGHGWCCWNPIGKMGFGKTPRAAYVEWLRLNHG